jgi:hypothetical protein
MSRKGRRRKGAAKLREEMSKEPQGRSRYVLGAMSMCPF